MKIELRLMFYTLRIALLISPILIHSVEAFDNGVQRNSNQECTIGLPELMLSLANKKEQLTHFKEEKFLKILEKPLRSEGTLNFRAPDYLEKITNKPEKERLVVKEGEVSIFDKHDKPQTILLDDYPPLKELLNGIRFTLLGNLNGLMKNYELDFQGNCNQWNLVLVPISTSTLNILDRIIILGKKDTIEKITWVEADGDFTVMTIDKEDS